MLPGTYDPYTAQLTHIGNATVLLELGPFTVLTDPSFLHKGEHVHLGYGLTSKRVVEPSLRPEDLPPIDLVVLSHLHEDHFDVVAEAALDHTIPIVTTPHAAEALKLRGFTDTHGIDTWHAFRLERKGSSLQVTATPAQHGPRIFHKLLPPTMGSLLDYRGPRGEPFWLYISGDTLAVEQLREIPRRFPDIDLALLHLGGTRVLGVLVTADAEHGLRMLRAIDPDEAIPVHYDDFDVFKSPLADFKKAVRSAGLEGKVRYLERGKPYRFRIPGAPAEAEPPPPELHP